MDFLPLIGDSTPLSFLGDLTCGLTVFGIAPDVGSRLIARVFLRSDKTLYSATLGLLLDSIEGRLDLDLLIYSVLNFIIYKCK